MSELKPGPEVFEPVMAVHAWRSNAELIEACARLGYLRRDWLTLDPTYGKGTFWQQWRPSVLVGCDLDEEKSPLGRSVDFTSLPWPARVFDSVVFDPPYKLNGTPTTEVDERYGSHAPATREGRMGLLLDGFVECARVINNVGYLLVKCQDQVCGGKVRWQTLEIARQAAVSGFGLVDRLDLLSYRPQPAGRTQVHARRNTSTLLVFKRGWSS